MLAEMIRLLNDLADLREQRIVEARAELPRFFWDVAAGLIILALALGLAQLAAPSLSHTVAFGAAAVALLLAFVVIVDEPFSGETSVSPKEISKAMQLNARRR